MNLKIRITNFLKPKDIPRTSAQPPAVFRLSDDILISIFLLNVEEPISANDWVNGYLPWDHHSTHRTTRRTSQVCRHWRLVALMCPTLWSNIVLSSKYFWWVQEIIQRATICHGSGRVSLFCFSWDASSQVTPQLLSHVYSYYGMASTALWFLLAKELASPIAQLESLCVLPACSPNSFESVKLTRSLTLGKPTLKKLSFDSCFPIDITQPNLSSITTLAIRGRSHPRPTSAVSLYKTSEILSALANMPSLQELSLSVSFQNTNYLPHSVDLPFLASLKLDSCYFSISLLLRYINVPLSCSMHISCQKSETTGPITDDMIYHIVAPVARNMAFASTQNLRITLLGHSFSIAALPPMSDTVIPRTVWNAQSHYIYISPTIGEQGSIFNQMMAVFHDVFQTTTHLTLDLSIAINCPIHIILRLLQPFTELVTISLNDHHNIANFFSSIKFTRDDVQEDLLPALHNIKLVGISEKHWSLDALVDFLTWRLERDKGVHTLDFYFYSAVFRTREIDITKKQLFQLEQIVVDINAYHVDNLGNHIKAAILHPILGTRCQLQRIRNISDGLPNEQTKDRKIFPSLGRRK